MPPGFHGDAIELSGETGTMLKSEIIGDYYPLWWKITSGGESRDHPYDTSIIELNAGTGEDYVADVRKTILGSSGHALELKATNSKTRKLTVVLFEDDADCFGHLKSVVRRRWPKLDWSEETKGDTKRVYLVNADLTSALSILNQIHLGNSLFFFDPLLFTPWIQIDSVARKRIRTYYATRTEFIVFLFTSDWFNCRKGLISPLPKTNDGKWSAEEKDAVEKCDQLFGHTTWRAKLLTDMPSEVRIRRLVGLYRDRLHTWFRYVLPLPFEPKTGQTYHLFMCSNYEDGVDITKGYYAEYTRNDQYSPDNDSAYKKFVQAHPGQERPGNSKSVEWKILWRIIKYHEEGLCDTR